MKKSKNIYICKCQDSSGTPHNKQITKKEYDQDGMCTVCANEIWTELTSKKEYKWFHKNK